MPYSFGLKWNFLQSLKNSITVEAVEIKKLYPLYDLLAIVRFTLKHIAISLTSGFTLPPFFWCLDKFQNNSDNLTMQSTILNLQNLMKIRENKGYQLRGL